MIKLIVILRGSFATRYVWESVKPHLEQTPNGYIIFDDTILDNRHARKISLAQRQYSGNAHTTINGIGVVTYLYVNPALDRYWIIDFRIYDKQGDGKSKLDHVHDMLDVLVNSGKVAFSTVLMDSWYASKVLMLFIESLGKSYDLCQLTNCLCCFHGFWVLCYKHIAPTGLKSVCLVFSINISSLRD